MKEQAKVVLCATLAIAWWSFAGTADAHHAFSTEFDAS